MKIVSLGLSIIVILFISGCQNEERLNPKDSSYFPLHVGDSWLYKPANELYPDMNAFIPTVSREIIGTSFIDGDEYFLVVITSYYPDSKTQTDSTYYRVDPSTEFVYEYKKQIPELQLNPFRLSANLGDRWHYSFQSTEDDMALNLISTVDLNGSSIENCKRFYYDVALMADEEHYTVLAPNLGIVSLGNAWGFDLKLQKATINGQTFQFF